MGVRISVHSKADISDEDLIRSSRTGDSSALESLYDRHHHAGLRFARRLMGNKADAEDIAHEAFLKVAAAINRGNGPETAFRPYLLRAVRTAAADRWEEQSMVTPTESTGNTPVEDTNLASLLHRDDPELVMKAFQSLPLRWMTVLWHAEVEREPPRRIAPILGIEPGAVSALLLRARKGLREAYLNAYAEAPPRTECEPTFPYLAATVLGTGSARDRRKVKEHTRECDDCAKVLAELTDVGATMRGILAPLLLVPSGIVLPEAQLPAKNSTAPQTAVLTAGAILVAAVSVAAISGLVMKGQPTAVPAPMPPSVSLTVPSPPHAPPAYATAVTPPSVEEHVALEEPVPAAVEIHPAEVMGPQQRGARSAPGMAALFKPSEPSSPPKPASTAIAPPAAAPAPSATPTPTPAATAPSTAGPTGAPTPTMTPTPAPTGPSTEPECTLYLLWCLSG